MQRPPLTAEEPDTRSTSGRVRAWRAWVTRPALLLAVILAVGAALRFYGLNWDGGHWLHPDERQIFFVVEGLGWPTSLTEALSPASPLNPRFFAYGSLSIYLLKIVSALLAPIWPALRDVDNLHLVARPLAALFDLGTVYLTYRLARTLWQTSDSSSPAQDSQRGEEPVSAWVWPSGGGIQKLGFQAVPLLAAAFVSLAVLHTQLAHFYTADPLLAFFVMLTLNLAAEVARGGGCRWQVALGIALGLTLATKVSALPLILAVAVAFYTRARTLAATGVQSSWRQSLPDTIRHTALTLILAVAVFFLVQPYALIDWRTFVDHTFAESQIARGAHLVPYTIQYAGTLPFFYSMWQMALWGLALPLGLAAWAGLAASFVRWLRRGPWQDALLLAWAGPYFVITGLLYAKYLRYMLPLVPVLCILVAVLVAGLARRRTASLSSRAVGLSFFAAILLLAASLVYALLFATLYAAPPSWIEASAWIYRKAPLGSTLAIEHWDTALPLIAEVDGVPQSPTDYAYRTLPLYDEPDDAAKWAPLAEDLVASDYLVIASRRLYGSIPRLPDDYPVATRYYDRLFAGELGFELAGEFARGPEWLNPRLPPLPGAAPALFHPDESFVVYDHPRALIFRNVEHLPAGELLRRLDIPKE